MRKLAIGAFALAAVVSSIGATAHAAPGAPPEGRKCGFNSVTDPGTEDGSVQTGEINGGPLLGTGTLTCTIQVGGATHDAANNGASASVSGSGVVVLPPTLVSYVSPENVPVYLCTQFNDGTTTWYWTPDPTTPTVGTWSTSAASLCGLATSAGTDDLEPYEELLDQIICPVLATLGQTLPDVPGVLVIDDEGDITIADTAIWDCPPYGV